MLWEEFASFPRGWASAFPPFGRLPTANGRMHRGQPALGRHRPVSILVETSGCCCKGSRDSSASESVCLRRGGHPAERAGSGVWVGTPAPVDLSSPRWAPPLQQSAASTLPEESPTAPRAEEKSHDRELHIFIYIYRNLYDI